MLRIARFNIALRDQGRLTSQYLQHEAIEAQRAMVGSPNHTTIYIPVGPMGVQLVGTFGLQRQPKPAPEAPSR